METYRSGHNGAHSKCVSPNGLVGSNPTVSAKKPTSFILSVFIISTYITSYQRTVFYWYLYDSTHSRPQLLLSTPLI